MTEHNWELTVGGSWEDPRTIAYCTCGCQNRIYGPEIKMVLDASLNDKTTKTVFLIMLVAIAINITLLVLMILMVLANELACGTICNL